MKKHGAGGGLLGLLSSVAGVAAGIFGATHVAGTVALIGLTGALASVGLVIYNDSLPENEEVAIHEYECTCEDCIHNIGDDIVSGLEPDDSSSNSIGGDFSGTHSDGSLAFKSENMPDVDTEGTQNAQEMYRILVSELGYSHAAACGVIGNAWQETGGTFNPRIWQGFTIADRSANINEYFGLFQSSLRWVIVAGGDPYSFDNFTTMNQLDINSVRGQVLAMDNYAKYENGTISRFRTVTSGGSYESFKQETDPEIASDMFLVAFENAVGGSDAVNVPTPDGGKYQHAEKRRKYASQADDYFKSATTTANNGSNSSTSSGNNSTSNNTSVAQTNDPVLNDIMTMQGLSGYRWGDYPIEIFALSTTYELGTSDKAIRTQKGDAGQAYTFMQLDYRYDLVPAMHELYEKDPEAYAGFKDLLGYKAKDRALVNNQQIVDTFNHVYDKDKAQYARDVCKFFYNEYTVPSVNAFKSAGIDFNGRHVAVVAALTSCNVNRPNAITLASGRVNNNMSDGELLEVIYAAWKESRQTSLGKRLTAKGGGGEIDMAFMFLEGTWIPSEQDSPRNLKIGWDASNVLEMAGQKSGTGTIARPGGSISTDKTPGSVKLTYDAGNVDIPNWSGAKLQRDYIIDSCEKADLQVHLLPDSNSSAFNGTIDSVVVHYWYGTGKSGDNLYGTFAGNGLSSNFSIGTDGVIWQLVPVNRAGFANNDNSNRLSIEVSDLGSAQQYRYSEASYKSLVHLVAYLCVEYNLSTDTLFSKNPAGNNYWDKGDIHRHYDNTKGGNFRGKGCPVYWVPKDGSSENDNIATAGGNARWIAFKEDVTDYILKYKNDPNFKIDGIIGIETAAQYRKPDSNANWKNASAAIDSIEGVGIELCYGCTSNCKCGCTPASSLSAEDIKELQESGQGTIVTPETKQTFSDGLKINGTRKRNNGGVVDGLYHITEDGEFIWDLDDTWGACVMMAARDYCRKVAGTGVYKYLSRVDIEGLGNMRLDCSGLVGAVLKSMGYNINPLITTADHKLLNSQLGFELHTDFNELQAGDIIVWRGKTGHMSIFCGWQNKGSTLASSTFYCYDFGDTQPIKEHTVNYDFFEPRTRSGTHTQPYVGFYRPVPLESYTINGITFTP